VREGQFVVDPLVYLKLKSNGLTDQEIADHCSVHRATVRNRLSKLYRDLGAVNGYHAVAIARTEDLIPEVTFSALDDGHGNMWERCSSTCKMEIVRPGKVQCDCD
jgi:DNA-binding CsgD family transcriptional regulator